MRVGGVDVVLSHIRARAPVIAAVEGARNFADRRVRRRVAARDPLAALLSRARTFLRAPGAVGERKDGRSIVIGLVYRPGGSEQRGSADVVKD